MREQKDVLLLTVSCEKRSDRLLDLRSKGRRFNPNFFKHLVVIKGSKIGILCHRFKSLS